MIEIGRAVVVRVRRIDRVRMVVARTVHMAHYWHRRTVAVVVVDRVAAVAVRLEADTAVYEQEVVRLEAWQRRTTVVVSEVEDATAAAAAVVVVSVAGSMHAAAVVAVEGAASVVAPAVVAVAVVVLVWCYCV